MKALPISVLSFVLLACASPVSAGDIHFVHGPDGRAVFELRFFDAGEGPFIWLSPEPDRSTWTLSDRQKKNVHEAAAHWAEIIKPAPTAIPAIINVGTSDIVGAAATIQSVLDDQHYISNAQAALLGKKARELRFGSHAQYFMGLLDFNVEAYVPSQLPQSVSGVDFTAVAFHELAHGLGMANDYQADDDVVAYRFPDALNGWSRLLRDDNGHPARPFQEIVCPPGHCDVPYNAGAFDVRQDQAYLSGPHIDEVINGGLRGIPVKILYENGDFDGNVMSHSELKNSLMSHQTFRNYTGLMEAEIALMQDLGYDIDRRNFFGYSVYGSGLHIRNQHGYFARNAHGTAYLPGQPNTARLGLGLHVYGSNTMLRQQADLLTVGPGGAGIRVDGQRNTIVVEPATRIHADGLNGRGIMFAYGKEHHLIHQGDVQALGEGGIALSIDFGSNAVGNDGGRADYRGSYIYRVVGGVYPPLLDELNGPLMQRVDLTGRLAGSSAAIYISPNALVENINVMQGATLHGDVYSLYNETDAAGRLRLTEMSFGQSVDSFGQANGAPDAAFDFTYNGNIQGGNLALTAQGGRTTLNGYHEIYSMTIEPGATLAGDSHYAIVADQKFVNDGTLAPGNSIGRIAIDGNYQQGTDATLLMETNGHGEHDILAVSGSADLNGSLVLAPQSDWYASGWTVRSDELVQATSVVGALSAADVLLASPTLQLEAQWLKHGVVQFTMSRPDNAYSQYGRTENARRVGGALAELVTYAGPGLWPLYQTLDFSAVNGSTVANALDQLSPDAYSTMFASSLVREQHISELVAGSGRAQHGVQQDWHAFVHPFGGGFHQRSRGTLAAYDTTQYGAVFGVERPGSPSGAWTVGLHGAVSQQSVSAKSPHNAKGSSTAFGLGVHGRYHPAASGAYLYGQGRLGIEDVRMTRRIGFDGYTANNRGSWTGYSAALAVGGGYEWEVHDTVRVGPVASLNYTWLSRPGMIESGSSATRLALASAHFNSLRSSVGIRGQLAFPRQSGATLTADLGLSWDRQWLDRDVVQNARFAGYQAVSFEGSNTLIGRDALGVRAALQYEARGDISVGASVSTHIRSGYRSVTGNLSLTKRF